MPYPHETWSKSLTHEVINLTKFHEDRAKIVEFLLIANFGMCAVFFYSDFKTRTDVSGLTYNDVRLTSDILNIYYHMLTIIKL